MNIGTFTSGATCPPATPTEPPPHEPRRDVKGVSVGANLTVGRTKTRDVTIHDDSGVTVRFTERTQQTVGVGLSAGFSRS